MFLAGNHTVNTTVNLTSISEITLRGERNSQVNILCSIEVVFLFKNVSNLRMEGLAFLTDNMTINSPALNITESNGVWIHKVAFQGNYSISKPLRGLYITSSNTITVTSCYFEGNTAIYGGAIYVFNIKRFTLNASTFIGNNAVDHGGAICALRSKLALSDNMFSGNTAGIHGGAIFAVNSVVTINDNKFTHNRAIGDGGAMYMTRWSSVTITDIAFTHNSANGDGGAMYSDQSNVNITGSTKNSSILSSEGYCRTCDMITTIPKSIPYEEVIMELNEALCATHFTNNTATRNGGAMSIKNSKVLFSGSVIMFRHNFANDSGGALFAERNSRATIVTNVHHLFFISNRARLWGGGILRNFHAEDGNLYFLCNSANRGGAIYAIDGLWFFGNSYFIANRAFWGGAIHIEGFFDDTLILTENALFSENNALYGGAIASNGIVHNISGKISFINNTAEEGGALLLINYNKDTIFKGVEFVNNTAHSKGGGILIRIEGSIFQTNISIQLCKFIGNTAGSCGGAIYTENGINVFLDSNSAVGNSNSALCIFQSRITISGRTNISNNIGTQGGGIKVTQTSYLEFGGRLMFDGNRGELGGAISLPFGTKLLLVGIILFSRNTADRDGGAIYAQQANITFANKTAFMYNTAENGGAIYLTSTSFLIFNEHVYLSISYNHATKYGGGIYHEDIASAAQCDYEKSTKELSTLPYCFIDSRYGYSDLENSIHSQNNSAGINGKLLYGGLLDRCQPITNNQKDYNMTFLNTFQKEIQSHPYRLCFCESVTVFNCSYVKSIEIYPREKFYLSLIAFDQLQTTTTTVNAITNSSWITNAVQRSQILKQGCSKLSYNLYPTNLRGIGQLLLYPEGPCSSTWIGRAIVNVTFRQCPHGFKKANSGGDECVCDDILKAFGPTACTIDDNVIITKLSNGTGSEFWVKGWYENGTYQGIIGYKTCPKYYCKTGELNISLENPDTQCDLNRSGLLCGECASNHSLMLGSFRCKKCSNVNLTLLLPFALMGIALTVSLIFLRLTVATGMINSIILYANIVQVNRKLFFPANQLNIFTIFIAWMNLDLGFETCFFHGLDEYLQTWLQLVFPLYIWIILGSIIFTSRYSITMSKLTGSNPVAVLATLLLMSYTKILKIIVEVYSSVRLEYPNEKTVSVWLKDANVPYLQSKHLLLTVVVTLILIFAFLPYTLLLLLGYKTYHFSGRRYNLLLRRLRPLLESYYGPYETHTRYWTGFLLLVRCALYMVFSYNSLGGERKSLLAIVIVFTGVTITAWLSVKIYKKFIVNVIEASIYLNLVVFSAATLADANSPALVYSLVGVTLATLIGIMVYHFHIRYVTRTAFWQRVESKVTSHFKNKPKETDIVDLTAGTNLSSDNPTKLVTKTHIDLREPLLDD